MLKISMKFGDKFLQMNWNIAIECQNYIQGFDSGNSVHLKSYFMFLWDAFSEEFV